MRREPILVVDDNPMNLKLVRFLLQGENYDVRTAGDSVEALKVLEGFHPRLILMDLQLPGMDGLELTRLLKSNPAMQDILIVALTAYTMGGIEEAALSAGCDGFLTKPIDTRTLPATVKQFLDAKQISKPETQTGDYRDLLTELRTTFLIEGMEEGRGLCDRTQEFDAGRAKMIAHRWAGIAGTLGFDEIGKKARSIENSLDEPQGTRVTEEYGSRSRTDLLEILQMFAEAVRGRALAAPLPGPVVRVLTGMSFALIGFGKAEASRMERAFGQAFASINVFDEMPTVEALHPFDGVIVNLCERCGRAELALGKMINHTLNKKPVVLVGSSTESLILWPEFLGRSCDFILAPWDSDEVVLRACRLVLDRAEPARYPAPERPRAVIADDDPAVIALVRTALEKLGFQCFVAHDGRVALELAREKLPQVMVLDVKMPYMEGFEVLLSLKQHQKTRGISVVMLTGRDDDSEMMRGFGCGADDYVTKPFKPAELAARVLRLLPQVKAPAYVLVP